MATHTHLPSPPYFAELVRRNTDGTYDFTECERALSEWRKSYDAAIDRHNTNMKKPWLFRALTGYRNPESLPHVPELPGGERG
jgi:hypothetical protein